MRVGVVVVAGGQGTRIGGAAPKQLQEIGGQSLLRRSVVAFDRHPATSEIVVVLPAALVPDGAALIGSLSRTPAVVAGGRRRQDSVANGVAAVSRDVDVILVHDAARPFVSSAVIDRVIAGAAESGAAIPGVPVRDTVKRISPESRMIAATVPRDEVWLAQTPQGFRRQLLVDILARADGADVTDEAMLAERAGHAVKVVDGDTENVKITEPGDLEAARTRSGMAVRVGTGYDLHRLVAGRPLTLAGVTIPFERGPLGHSDGDVVCHALVDAMLGAAGAGDIGRHFPNTDATWKDAPGLDLLARALVIIRERAWSVLNVDVTVVLEQPKLSPFLPKILSALAGTIGIPEARISVKGKTNEGVDAVGRGEAIASHAVVLLESAGSAR